MTHGKQLGLRRDQSGKRRRGGRKTAEEETEGASDGASVASGAIVHPFVLTSD